MKLICKWKNKNNIVDVSGKVYYLNTSNGSNSNDGLTRFTPFLTQVYAESIMTNGDVLLNNSTGTGQWGKAPLSEYVAFRLNDTIYYPTSENSNINITASRTSGVAPLAVFFDATGSAIADTSFFAADGDSINGSYMDATFYWDFDSTNVDATIDHKYGSGFVAACVFKEPGTYTVQLKVYDNTGFIGYKNQTIIVSAFSGTTYYVAADGSDSGTGAIDDPWLTPEFALNATHLAANRRVLFKNGDTFNISSQITVSDETGTIIIGGYSDPLDPSSDKPIIHTTAVNSDWATVFFWNCSDVRIMDIECTALGESSESPRYPYGIGWGSDCTNMLKYRTVEHDNGGISLSPAGHYSTIAECEFYNTTQTGYTDDTGGGTTNDGNALIGNYVHHKNTVDSENEEHVFRLQGGSRYYIGYNNWNGYIKVNEDSLTLRGNSEKVVVYKNTIKGYVQNVSPQNRNSSNEQQHHIIFDANKILGQDLYENDRVVGTAFSAKDIVIRNNIIYDYNYGVMIRDDSVVGESNRIRVYNNTFINPTSRSGTFVPICIDSPCLNLFFRNNIMLDVGNGTPDFIELRDGSTYNLTSDYNIFYGINWGANPTLFGTTTLATWRTNTSQDLHSSTNNPNLVSTDPNNANFGKLSGALEGESLLYNALDYYGNLRGSSIDVGACEYI